MHISTRQTVLFAATAFAMFEFMPGAASAAVPVYDRIQLQARASIGSGATTFNLPAGSAFSSATPDINNNRAVSFKALLNGSTGDESIWYGTATSGAFGSGGIVYDPGDADSSLSDPALNNLNTAVFPRTFASSGNGIYRYEASTNTSSLHSAGPLGASSWSSPRMNDSGQVGARVSFSSGQAYVSYGVTPSQVSVHATDKAADPSSPYSFLSSPNFDNSRRIVGRVNIGASFNNANPDEIRLFSPDGSSSLIARDHDGDASSPFFQFDTTAPGLNDNGFAAFISRTSTASSSRSLFLSDGSTSVTIAAPGMATTAGTTITSIDNFSPNVNNSNQVVFRATDSSGVIGVFVGDGTTLVRVARIGDLVQTDIGAFAINSFGGNPTINDLGDVAFGGGLGAGGNFIAVALVPEPVSLATLALVASFVGANSRPRRRALK